MLIGAQRMSNGKDAWKEWLIALKAGIEAFPLLALICVQMTSTSQTQTEVTLICHRCSLRQAFDIIVDAT